MKELPFSSQFLKLDYRVTVLQASLVFENVKKNGKCLKTIEWYLIFFFCAKLR